MLGKREEDIYGNFTLGELEAFCRSTANSLSMELDFFQTNSESEIVNLIQKVDEVGYCALIINAAGFSHTSVAILDALLTVKLPKVELHLSNIYKRENFRSFSYISKGVDGVITGLGPLGYVSALYAIENITK